jgi:hypothetical protein
VTLAEVEESIVLTADAKLLKALEDTDFASLLRPLDEVGAAIPGYNTYLFYHPDLDAVVVVLVNSDYSSGKCPKDVPIMKEWPRTVPCELPADRIFEALAEALGKPSPSPPETSSS